MTISTIVDINIGSLIEGPIYIGESTTVNIGSKLRAHSSFGPQCRIGGEIENSIIQGYSNKQHDGFLGHSYIGEWVNIGANTNTSDLKNNYNSIRISISGSDVIETGHKLLGSIVGDHVKTGISTMLNTGTYIGLGATIFGSGFQPKHVRSFSWGSEDVIDFDKFINTARTVKNRRGKTLSEIEISTFKNAYESLLIN